MSRKSSGQALCTRLRTCLYGIVHDWAGRAAGFCWYASCISNSCQHMSEIRKVVFTCYCLVMCSLYKQKQTNDWIMQFLNNEQVHDNHGILVHILTICFHRRPDCLSSETRTIIKIKLATFGKSNKRWTTSCRKLLWFPCTGRVS